MAESTDFYGFQAKYGKDDPRLGSLVAPGTAGQIVLLGFPWDEGVRRNGGRVGAAQGPGEFRKHWPKLGSLLNLDAIPGAQPHGEDIGSLFDALDVRTVGITDAGDAGLGAADLEAAHTALRDKVSQLLKDDKIPVIIGGGNDQSWPNAAAMISAASDLTAVPGVVNIDAHLDVRPLVNGQAHSGSPFRQLLTDPSFQKRNGRFVEFGSQGHVCSADHWRYVLSRPNTQILPLSQFRYCPWKTQAEPLERMEVRFERLLREELGDEIFVSFDIDSIQASDCPGVSAPGNVGLTAQEAMNLCFLAGANPKVRLIDFSEFNPTVEAHVTGRLVVSLVYFFALGVAKRKKAHGGE